MDTNPFSIPVKPDWEGFYNCVTRRAAPARVHFVELFLDWEVQEAIAERFSLLKGLDTGDPFFAQKRMIAIQRFLGYDYVVCGPEGAGVATRGTTVKDTAELTRGGGRGYAELNTGPITNWEEFRRYPWPDPDKLTTKALEWYEKNLPDDMCVIGGLLAHFVENIISLMGYETLCTALFEDRALVAAVRNRLFEIDRHVMQKLLQFDRVRFIWGSDDMGFRTSTLISPADLREFVLPGHKFAARMAHEKGRPYLLHSCGNLSAIMDDLIDDVKIDAKHSFEDTIESPAEAKRKYGNRLALLGGIDLDFLCRRSEAEVRKRVRETLSACMPGGGYCLGTGNSVANYVPVSNYLAMLDEGRKFMA